MKKIKLTLLILLVSLTCVFAQSKKKVIKPDTTKTDTVYQFTGDKTMNLIYGLLQNGYRGVASSPHYSQDQANDYQKQLNKLIDSIFMPQIKKYHKKP